MDTQERIKQDRAQGRAHGVSRFVALIPHRDALKPLEEYRRGLFAAGFPGAHSFPLAAPLASVSRPFSRDELKELAGNIRGLTVGAGGKIQGGETAFARCGPFSFLGVALDFPIEESLFPRAAQEKIIAALPFPALCAALAGPGEESRALGHAPPLSFRAAFAANLALRPLPCGGRGYSFEWIIGPPAWLPKYVRPCRAMQGRAQDG